MSRSVASSRSKTASVCRRCKRLSPEKPKSRSTWSISCAAASPSMRSGCSSRTSPCATARWPLRRRRTRHTACSPRSSAARRCACCMCAKAGSCFRASVAAPSRRSTRISTPARKPAPSQGSAPSPTRTRRVRYSLESGSVTATGGAESFPLALTLTSKLFRARLNGTASNTAGFTIDGDMQAEIDDGRRFFKWIGIRIPDGDSLRGFSAAGAFHLAGSTLTFDDGTFTLDGNKAVGLLALTAGKPRPRVEGTLAFDRLVLDPYLGSAKPSAGKQPCAGLRGALPLQPAAPAIHRRRPAHLGGGNRRRRAQARSWRIHHHRQAGIGGERSRRARIVRRLRRRAAQRRSRAREEADQPRRQSRRYCSRHLPRAARARSPDQRHGHTSRPSLQARAPTFRN